MSYEPYHKTTIDCKKVRPYVKELVDRCGNFKQAADYAMISPNTIQRVMNNVHCTMRQGTARKIILALEHRREEDRKNHSVHERLRNERIRQAMIEERREREVV